MGVVGLVASNGAYDAAWHGMDSNSALEWASGVGPGECPSARTALRQFSSNLYITSVPKALLEVNKSSMNNHATDILLVQPSGEPQGGAQLFAYRTSFSKI